jgi:beta-catenin-like protein 1
MTSIDEIFKKPNLPSKRKLEVSHDPAHFYKSAKYSANGDAKSGPHAVVEDEPDNDDDVEAGPALPPDDEESGPEDDEDGRFFGGGVGRGAKAALDFVESRDTEEEFVEEKYDLSWLRKIALAFEKKISKNAELRAKYEDDPQKFMNSEADLDATIKDLSVLSEHPELYEEFAKLGCMASLISLLAHENADIAIDTIEIINELLDEDVNAPEQQWKALVDAAIDSDLLNLLVQNFERLDESQEADRAGLYTSLNILESLSSDSRVAEIIAQDATLLKWLLKRIQVLESPLSQTKQYAAEILSILVQSDSANRMAIAKLGAVDTILQLLAPYRRRDPSNDSNEEEYFENLFDILTCLVDEQEGKTKFIEAEGVELALIMLREGKMSKPRALRMLNHAVDSLRGGEVCMKVVEVQGLKTIFGLFMKRHDSGMTEHLLGIFAALLRTLPVDSPERIRTLAKFVEKDYEKIGKIVTLRQSLTPKVAAVSGQIELEKKALDGDEIEDYKVEWLLRRLDAGLYTLQTIDLILAWLCVEDTGAKKKIAALLAAKVESLTDIQSTLQEQLDGVADTDEDAEAFKDMLESLISLLKQ